MSQTEAERDPEPRVYAPLLVQIESEHPALAEELIGIGDSPLPFDTSRREVTARFKSQAGTEYSGKFHTEPSTAPGDAREFLARMVLKRQAIVASDKAVLAEPAAADGGSILLYAPPIPAGPLEPALDAAPESIAETDVESAPESAEADWDAPPSER